MALIKSEAGEAWEPFYKDKTISWANPDLVDLPFISKLAYGSWVRKLLAMSALKADQAEQSILEAGCGLGLYAMALALLGYNIIAFDYNEDAIRIAERIRSTITLLTTNPQFEVGNLLNIRQQANSFDLVFNQAVMEYFRDEVEFNQAIHEMIRVLKPGRRLVLIVQNTKHPLLPIKAKLGHRGFVDQPPVRPISADSLKICFKQHGLQDIRVDGIDPWKGVLHGIPFLSRNRLLHNLNYFSYRALRLIPLPVTLRSRLALQFIVSGEKTATD